MSRLLVRVATLLALIVLALTPATVVAGATAPASGVAWQPCPTPELPAQQCGALTVPLDYDEPDGATIAVAVARVPATDDALRIGSLITNPGGPGGSGVDALPLLHAALPETLTARFDLVGFDPRGVGQSTPVHCFDSISERTAFFAAIPTVPIGANEVLARQRAAEELARRCGERNADVLSHLSTANVARTWISCGKRSATSS